jgi:vacuolar-type H+-ATPase subunit B/Vma2
MSLDLLTRRHQGALGVSGPLLFLEAIPGARLGEVVAIRTPAAPGRPAEPDRRGQVIELSESRVVVQVLEETQGLSPGRCEITLGGEVASLGVGRALLGRVLDGLGRPADGGPAPIPEARLPGARSPRSSSRPASPPSTASTPWCAARSFPSSPAPGCRPAGWRRRSSASRG